MVRLVKDGLGGDDRSNWCMCAVKFGQCDPERDHVNDQVSSIPQQKNK